MKIKIIKNNNLNEQEFYKKSLIHNLLEIKGVENGTKESDNL